MRRICVFCGSREGTRPRYRECARELGSLLAREGIGIVYGGASVGLMGALADAALTAGGEVIGVIPTGLSDRELAHPGLSELREVATMHDRKREMAALADAFVTLPGGIGTLEELFEVLSWAMLGIHDKPCGLLDVDGYYRGLSHFMEHAMAEGFVRRDLRALWVSAEDPVELLAQLRAHRGPTVRRWLGADAT